MRAQPFEAVELSLADLWLARARWIERDLGDERCSIPAIGETVKLG